MRRSNKPSAMIKWIKDNAKRFAQQQGISEPDADLGDQFTNPAVRAVYESLRDSLKNGAIPTEEQRQAVLALLPAPGSIPGPVVSTDPDVQLLYEAFTRIQGTDGIVLQGVLPQDITLVAGGASLQLQGSDGALMLQNYLRNGNAQATIEFADGTYRYRLGDGSDILLDSGGSDTLTLLDLHPADVLIGQSWLGQMEIYIQSTGDVITLETRPELDPADQQLERIVFADGTVWGADEMNVSRAQTEAMAHNLVQAMASFSPQAAGQTFAASSWQNSLAPLFAANAQ